MATGSTIVFKRDTCRIFDKDCKVIGEIVMDGGLYHIYQECHHPDSKEFAGKVLHPTPGTPRNSTGSEISDPLRSSN